MQEVKFISIKEANDNKHKYIVTLKNLKTGRENNIKFGAYGMSHYTQHKDIKRKSLYDARHSIRENWNDPLTAGFWSKWILWNKPTFEASLKDTLKRFNF